MLWPVGACSIRLVLVDPTVGTACMDWKYFREARNKLSVSRSGFKISPTLSITRLAIDNLTGF